MDNPRCFSSHMGLWLMQPSVFSSLLEAVRTRTLPEGEPVAMRTCNLQVAKVVETSGGGLYAVHDNGIATISIEGSMTKGASKFGGTSSIAARQAVRAAVQDKSVEGLLMVIDSPGGHVAGTDELANEIARASAIKPVHAHIDDLGASAALWAASQAGTVSINRAGEVGSIGVFAVLRDSSGKAEREGIEYHVVSTGPMKGTGADGTPITKEILEAVQQRVDSVNELFMEAISVGRNLSMDDVKELATGEVWGAQKALELGLVDHIRSLEASAAALEAEINAGKSSRGRSGRARRAMANLDLLNHG